MTCTSMDQCHALEGLVAELRAVLRPLLDDPMHGEPSYCIFCSVCEYAQDPETHQYRVVGEPIHATNCPVRRRAFLLGLSEEPAPAPPGTPTESG